ncbi:hypothetical protein SD81_023955 [Tolypothrix campylonemoides VB511288]|nr:hypothetical protein SD81_023955 [Tolypothrix campylonemoides VB511288]
MEKFSWLTVVGGMV